jgi:hypothetical protein
VDIQWSSRLTIPPQRIDHIRHAHHVARDRRRRRYPARCCSADVASSALTTGPGKGLGAGAGFGVDARSVGVLVIDGVGVLRSVSRAHEMSDEVVAFASPLAPTGSSYPLVRATPASFNTTAGTPASRHAP